MEIKVWCDGVQRVVGGVSTETTCEELVLALAQSSAQTGRFILIEKWRNNERLLAPDEQPLAVMSKLSEFDNEVTFVMKRTEVHSSAINAKQHLPTITSNVNSLSVTDVNSQSKSLSTTRPRRPPPYEEAISKRPVITGSNATTSQSQLMQLMFEERSHKRPSLEPSPQNQKQRINGQKEQLEYRLGLHKQTMKIQEKDKLSLEQHITSMERKLLEIEHIIKSYKDEMTSVHQLWLEQEEMITQLDQRKLEEELDSLVAEAKRYEEEVIDMKKKLSNCVADIADCRQKIAELMEKLDVSESQSKIGEYDRYEQEEIDRLMVDQMKIAIRVKTREFKVQKSDLLSLTNSILQLDALLHEKRTLVDKLIAELKDNNNAQTAISIQTEDDPFKANRFAINYRTGSKIKMDALPAHLENGVATSKDSHGVWI